MKRRKRRLSRVSFENREANLEEQVNHVEDVVDEEVSLANKGSRTSPEIRWIKSSGALLLRGKLILPGEQFVASVEEIPLAFRDTCRPLDPLPAAAPIEYAPSVYRIVPAGTEGRFNIVDINGKQVNSKPLTSSEAERIVNMMS